MRKPTIGVGPGGRRTLPGLETEALSAGKSHLHVGISLLTVAELPAWSKGPKGHITEVLHGLADAGFSAVQTYEPIPKIAGLRVTWLARVDKPEDAVVVASRSRDMGCEAATLHVGTGFETDDEANVLIEAVLEAACATKHSLLVETHRATVTQDMKRTLDLVDRFPELRFTGDFSHWYTGAEMTHGSFEKKLDAIRPVLDRVRLVHGRISDPGCIQIQASRSDHRPHLDRFRSFWTRSFAGCLGSDDVDRDCGFYPELLPPSFFYARCFKNSAGEFTEEFDRWLEAIDLVKIAADCWAAASCQRSAASP